MRGNNKRLSFVLTVAVALGSASATAVAGSIGDTYATGDPLTAAKMTTIKDAVNDNNTRINNLLQNVPGTTCSTGMTRVGRTCVDNTLTAANVTWNDAVVACTAAGKRLLTPGEYIAALRSGLFADMTNGTFEWVDQVNSDFSVDGTSPGAGRMTVGYMGPDGGGNITAGDIFFGLNAAYDAAFGFISYRCAR
jgi:hypothetical protein